MTPWEAAAEYGGAGDKAFEHLEGGGAGGRPRRRGSKTFAASLQAALEGGGPGGR